MNDQTAQTPAPIQQQIAVSFADLSPREAQVLTSLVLFDNDTAAQKATGIKSERYFYQIKKRVRPLLQQLAEANNTEIMVGLSLAAKKAVAKLVHLMDQGGNEFQQGIADDVLDRFGVIKKTDSRLLTPVQINFNANKYIKEK